MKTTTLYFLLLFTCFFSINCQDAVAGTGIVEVNSMPVGAKVYLDGTYVGKTPYSNPEVSTGIHKVKVYLSDDYPARHWEFQLDDITPQTKKFIFSNDGGGKFTGIEEEAIVKKHLGNIQFASIPTGADLYINGEKRKATPVGYKDVNVGFYRVEFVLQGKIITGNFTIVKDETIKLIADFNSGVLINRWHEEQVTQSDKRRAQYLKEEQAKKDKKAREQKQKKAEAEKKRLAQDEADRKKPRELFSGSLNHGFRDLAYQNDIQVPLDEKFVKKYNLPSSNLTIKAVRSQYVDQSVSGSWFDKAALRIYTESSCGPHKANQYYYYWFAKRSWAKQPKGKPVSVFAGGGKYSYIKNDIVIPSVGTIKTYLLLEGKLGIYEKKGDTNHGIQANKISGTVTLYPN